MIALRLDESLEKEFSEAVESEGRTKSEVIRELMEIYLNRARKTPNEIFKSKFNYFKDEKKAIATRKPLSKSDLKDMVRKSIVDA